MKTRLYKQIGKILNMTGFFRPQRKNQSVNKDSLNVGLVLDLHDDLKRVQIFKIDYIP